ncbi:MAG: LytTR family DNA-binding domain-containing protein [Clostridia bacterium]|nr:LytTR family DNA-binding domain-containing protein [Clostridia bacterium]
MGDATELLKIAICDDEESALEIVAGAVESCFKNKGVSIILDKFQSVTQIEQRMAETAYDLLLLDIRLSNQDGIAFAAKLREKGNEVPVIFVSSAEERVFDTFAVKPFGFIRKSHFFEDTVSVLDAFISSVQKERAGHMIIKYNGRLVTIDASSVMYIESLGREQTIHFSKDGRTMTVMSSMQKFDDDLKSMGFMRIHKSYLVNYRFIRLIDTDEVVLTDNTRIPIGRTVRKTIRDDYLRLMGGGGSVIFA